VCSFAREQLGLTIEGVVPSSIKGPKGNQEFIAYMKKG
jgi:23S rRNA (cytidine1920-2'-O)/16S rRNA (cytidine1409-2'-O)-methyltransferase